MAWTPFTRADHDRSGLRYASDTSDEEWALIVPFMPPQPKRGRRRRTDLRAVIDAIFYLLQSSCQWGLLPKDFPPKSTVHFYFKRFAADGTWARIHDVLYVKVRDLEGREASPSYAIIDSQSVKTTAEARGDLGFDAAKLVKGRKRHILVDTLGLILKAEVHSAGIQDRDGAAVVFDKLIARFAFVEAICGDGAYQGPIVEGASPPADRDRQAQPERFRRAAKALDRRADLCLARHQPPPVKRLRALRRDQPCLHPNRHDQAHDATFGPIWLFLNRL